VSALHRYAGFGLTFECELPSPGFAPSDEPADVRIRIGAVPARLERPVVRGLTFEADAHRVLLRCPGSARFLIQEATDITMQPESEAPEDVVGPSVGAALGVLLIQRGAFMVHAAACASGQGAIVLTGFAGRGKSTLLAALVARGHDLLADDLVAIGLDASDHPIAHPAFAQFTLRVDSLGRLGLDHRYLRPILPGVAKYFVPAAARFCQRPQPIRAVYVLEGDSPEGIEVVPLTGQDRFAALRPHVYAPRLVEGLRFNRAQFSVAMALAAKVPVFRLRRPSGLAFVDGLADAIERSSC